jgi:hypothetical protein
MKENIKICNYCGEEISFKNTQTSAGWAEVDISGVCEKCFDDSTFDLSENLKNLDNFVLSLIKDGVILAGGALRSLVDAEDKVQDYDLFFLDQLKVEAVKNKLKDNNFNLIFECPKGELFSYVNSKGTKVQLILKRKYSSCEDIISSFDITACCCAYDGNNFWKNTRFIFDNLNKLININKVEYPIATMKRISKYISKGFKLTPDAASKFVTEVNSMKLDDNNTALYID